MIEEIKLRNISSYSSAIDTVFSPSTINLIYGHNGTGKSTLGRFLQSPVLPEFNQCSFQNPHPDSEIFVYNDLFIQQNFYEGTQPGVFTLSESNQTAELAIKDAEKVIGETQDKFKKSKDEGLALKNKIEPIRNDLRNLLWNEKITFERGPLDFCMEGFKHSKERFYEGVINAKNGICKSENLVDLVLQATELHKTQNQSVKKEIALPAFNFTSFELDPILSAQIVGSSDSYLSELIQVLNNSDWVQKGVTYLNINDKNCPFCQQPLNPQIIKNITDLFDHVYGDKISKLNHFKSEFEAEIIRVNDYFKQDIFMDDVTTSHPEIQATISYLQSILIANLQVIQNKILSPSTSHSLTSMVDILSEVNKCVTEINLRIDAFNQAVLNHTKHSNEIIESFWALIYKKYKKQIDECNLAIEAIDSEVNKIRLLMEADLAVIEIQKKIVAENREQTINIDLSVTKINNLMAMLGIQGFRLERESAESNYYHLVRDNQQKVYSSLSEGEKTLITFLYFVECCNGSFDKTKAVTLANRIVVIDDPVTSLSHNYVYDIASLIQQKIIQSGFQQVFVMTHSLFFLHELFTLKRHCIPKDLKNKYKCFRITKNVFSNIAEMFEADIKNDYQSYWQVLKDCKAGKAHPVVIPNMMRNILEYYFGFLQKRDALVVILNELGDDDIEFKPLARYINRQSHADTPNINDFGEINPDRYLEAFERVFVKADYKEHFDLMMG